MPEFVEKRKRHSFEKFNPDADPSTWPPGVRQVTDNTGTYFEIIWQGTVLKPRLQGGEFIRTSGKGFPILSSTDLDRDYEPAGGVN